MQRLSTGIRFYTEFNLCSYYICNVQCSFSPCLLLLQVLIVQYTVKILCRAQILLIFFKEVAQASFCSWQQYLQAAKDFTTLQNEPFRTHSSSKMIGEIRHGLRAPPSWPGIMPFPGAGEDGDAARGSLWCWQASPFLFSDQLSSFSARYATLWKITPIYACHVVIFL